MSYNFGFLRNSGFNDLPYLLPKSFHKETKGKGNGSLGRLPPSRLLPVSPWAHQVPSTSNSRSISRFGCGSQFVIFGTGAPFKSKARTYFLTHMKSDFSDNPQDSATDTNDPGAKTNNLVSELVKSIWTASSASNANNSSYGSMNVDADKIIKQLDHRSVEMDRVTEKFKKVEDGGVERGKDRKDQSKQGKMNTERASAQQEKNKDEMVRDNSNKSGALASRCTVSEAPKRESRSPRVLQQKKSAEKKQASASEKEEKTNAAETSDQKSKEQAIPTQSQEKKQNKKAKQQPERQAMAQETKVKAGSLEDLTGVMNSTTVETSIENGESSAKILPAITMQQVEEEWKTLSSKYGKAKAIKYGIRNEAVADFVSLMKKCIQSHRYQAAWITFDKAVKTIAITEKDEVILTYALKAAFGLDDMDLVKSLWIKGTTDFRIKYTVQAYDTMIPAIAKREGYDNICWALDLKREYHDLREKEESEVDRDDLGQDFDILGVNTFHALISALISEVRTLEQTTSPAEPNKAKSYAYRRFDKYQGRFVSEPSIYSAAELAQSLMDEMELVYYKQTKYGRAQFLRLQYRLSPSVDHIFKIMDSKQWKLSRLLGNVMLEECLVKDDIKSCSRVLSLMKRNKIAFSTSTFESILTSNIRKSKIDAAFDCLKLMRECSMFPQLTVVEDLCEACVVASERVLDCLVVLQDAESHYGTATCRSSPSFWSAKLLLNSRIFQTVLDEESLKMFVEMSKVEGLGVSSVICHRVYSAYKLVLKDKVSKQQQHKKQQLNSADGHSTSDAGDRYVSGIATKLLQNQLAWFDGDSGNIRNSSLSDMLEIAAITRSPKDAEELMNLWWREAGANLRAPPTSSDYAFLVAAYASRGLMDSAVDRYVDMLSKGVVPRECSVFRSLIQGYRTKLDLESTERVWREMTIEYKIAPIRETWLTLIDSCLYHPNGIAQACKYIEHMRRRSGYLLPQEYYGTLMKSLDDAKDLKSMLSIFREIQHQNIEISEVTLGVILAACMKSEDLPSVEQALQMMKRSGILLDHRVMNYLNQDPKDAKKKMRVKTPAAVIEEIRAESESTKQKHSYSEFDALLKQEVESAASAEVEDLVEEGRSTMSSERTRRPPVS